MNGILLLLVQTIEVVGCIAVIVWAVHEIKMAHRELRNLHEDVNEVREDLSKETKLREAGDRKLKETIKMVVKDMNHLHGRVKKLESKKI